MLRRLIIAAFLLPLGVALAHGQARAQTVYTPSSLGALLLSPNEIVAVIKIAGSSQTFDGGTDVPSSSDPVGVGRVYVAPDGSYIGLILFSLADGTPPPGALRAGVLGGDFLRTVVSGAFDSVSGFDLGPSLVGDGNDIAAAFVGTKDGASYKVIGDSFLRGNVFGVVYYASAVDDPDPLITAALVGGQTAKLP